LYSIQGDNDIVKNCFTHILCNYFVIIFKSFYTLDPRFWSLSSNMWGHGVRYFTNIPRKLMQPFIRHSNIWGFHGSDYEECRLLGYKNPVRTSQETRYVSATEPSRLMLCKILGFHGSDYEECRLLGYKNPSQEICYISATEPSLLMLCKILGCHGGDYEECRLLGYKNPVLTSQETRYFSATECSWLMLCKIWGFHGSNYVECSLLGCYTMWRLSEPTLRRNLPLPSSGLQESLN
jgi:hypothetical protein